MLDTQCPTTGSESRVQFEKVARLNTDPTGSSNNSSARHKLQANELSTRTAPCGAYRCPLKRGSSDIPVEPTSLWLDRCPRTGSAYDQMRRNKPANSAPEMSSVSSAVVCWLLAGAAISATCGAAAASQENLQAYPTRPQQQMQSLQQLSLEQSFHRPTSSVAASTKLAGTSGPSPQTNPPPQEQSRLARLCQQTSSVLASVLPAPFGGLKRSILCQFFGQIPLKGSPEDESPHTSIAVLQHLSPQTGYPNIALPLPISSKHPIELVIDQHRRDYLLAQQQQSPADTLIGPYAHDLGTSSSILNYAYEKGAEVPRRLATALKGSGFSAPFDQIFRPATKPQVSNSPLMSTSGWRIFNQFDLTTSTTVRPSTERTADAVSTSTTASNTNPSSATTTNSTSVTERSMRMKDELRPASRDAARYEKISLLVIGKPPQVSVQNQQQQQQLQTRKVAVTKPEPPTTTTQRMESTKSTASTQPAPINPTPPEPSVRTIEVNAQIMNTSTIILAPLASELNSTSNTHNEPNSGKTAASSRTGGAGKPDLNQVRLREELVIASINNLTRIAFGNHLRDTVKVINKLIDQQSDLFSNVAAGLHKDPMVPAESKQLPGSVIKSSPTPAPPSNSSSSTVKSANRKSTSKDGRPAKSRFLKQATSQQPLSSTTSRSTGKPPAGSAFSFPEAPNDWRRLSGSSKSGSYSKSKQGSKASIIGEMQQDKSPWLVSLARLPTTKTTTSTSRASFQSWLAPDKSFTVSRSEDASIDLERKWDSKKQQPAATHQTPGLVLNRLSKDKLGKRDSLTTLKSYLATRPPSGTTTSPVTSQTTGAQSRWMPTIISTGPLQLHLSVGSGSKSPSSTTGSPPRSPPSTTSTPSLSSSVAATAANVTSIGDLIKSESQPYPSSIRDEKHAAVSENTMPSSEATYEARATDSINRYTTHLNDANELLATTRRFSLQPLPQTAQTGEFFNAETIASWPERYQTRIGQALEGSTVSMGDTTRRSGETYQSTTLSRHRMDAGGPTTQSLAPPTTLYASSRLTTLPANHKLTTPMDHQSTTASLPAGTDPVPSTRRSTSYSTPSPHSVAYTLIGPYTQSDSELDTGVGDEFPLVAADHPHALSIYIEQPVNGSGVAGPLRPPYAKHHPVLDYPQSIDELESLALVDREQYLHNRTYARQKFLEMLSPAFVSGEMQSYPAAAVNQQRFNLSALKFLTQNLLSARQNSKPSDEPLYRHNESGTWRDQLLANEMDNSHLSSHLQVPNLLDLLSEAAHMQANRFDAAMLNESLSSANSSTADSNKASKSILGRAGNLLSDLKHLEQKRAAALLAAIRYQVPSPLVKPWEVSPSFYHFGDSNSNLAARISSRLDSEPGGIDQDYLVDDLLLNKLIRMALRKQRVVSRSVLEARLRQADKRGDDSVVEHPSDSIEGTSEQLSADKAIEFKLDGSSDESGKSDGSGISMHSATSRLVSKLLNRRSSNVRQDYGFEDSNQGRGDIGQLKDIRQLHQKDAADHLNKSEWPVSENARVNPSQESPVNSAGDKEKLMKEEAKGNFECANRPAGFYPDATTTCRTFYHCSSTGHLLTFNCPQQSRFDERSLKCGPWYEVACDLRRIR